MSSVFPDLQSKRRCYICGWHGQLNFGDDVFAVVTEWGARRYLNSTNMFMSSDLSGKLHGMGLKSSFGSSIPFVDRWRFGRHRQLASTWILAGGNSLPNEETVHQLLADKHWCMDGRQEIAVGISVGPFQSSSHEDATAELLDRMKFVGFRDRNSFDWAKARSLKTRFTLCFDIAPLLPFAVNDLALASPQPLKLGLSLISHHIGGQLVEKFDSGMRDLAKCVSHVVSDSGHQLQLFAFCTNPDFNDINLCEQFAAACDVPTTIFQHSGDPIETYREVASCSHMLSMRLHGAVMAYTAGRPAMILSYHPKCRQFAEFAGIPDDHVLDFDQLDISTMEVALKQFLSDNSSNAVTPIADAQALALLNFENAAEALGLSLPS